MPKSIKSYWELIEPYYLAIDIYNEFQKYAESTATLPRTVVLLHAAHMCQSEIHNGGFLQLFWNNTGVLVPEGIEGFNTIGMPRTASILRRAAEQLSIPFPRERDDRWDALLVATGRSTRELKKIFKQEQNLYIAFAKATSNLPFDDLDKQFWEEVKAENGGFPLAATRYARDPFLIQ
jgi:hypothetical protein